MIFTILLRKYMLKRKEELFALLFTYHFLFLNTNKLVASAAMAVIAYPKIFVLAPVSIIFFEFWVFVVELCSLAVSVF